MGGIHTSLVVTGEVEAARDWTSVVFDQHEPPRKNLQRRYAPVKTTRGGKWSGLLQVGLGLRDELLECFVVAVGSGQSHSPHELCRLAGAGGVVDPVIVLDLQTLVQAPPPA